MFELFAISQEVKDKNFHAATSRKQPMARPFAVQSGFW
jgi:hypothetical protein